MAYIGSAGVEEGEGEGGGCGDGGAGFKGGGEGEKRKFVKKWYCSQALSLLRYLCGGGGTAQDLAYHPESSGCKSPHLHRKKLYTGLIDKKIKRNILYYR